MSFILGPVSVPGGSAEVGYRAARKHQRRGLALASLLLVLSVGCGWAVFRTSGTAQIAAGGAALVLAAGALVARPRPDPQRWLRGAAGERATASLLEGLPARRWAVMHDLAIPGSRANIDHLVIGPTGVWVVDTKATRTRIRSRRRSVRFGDRKLDSDPTRWEAEVASQLLGVSVRPIIAVHGEGMRPRGSWAGGVRVVPASALVKRLRRGRRRLRRLEVAQVAGLAHEILAPTSISDKGRRHRG